jgi:hypothetical protein
MDEVALMLGLSEEHEAAVRIGSKARRTRDRDWRLGMEFSCYGRADP